jgi:hypothetical protein
MNPASKSRSGGREPKAGASVDTRNKKVPNADMQAEDAGTPDSGVTGNAGKVEGAMKQFAKTGKEKK